MEKLIEDSFLVNLNTANNCISKNGTALSDIVFNTKNILLNDNTVQFSEVQVLNINMPISFYGINANNNILNYSIGLNYSIIIPFGNYNAYDFINTLESLFLVNGHTFSITLNSKTGILNFNYAETFSFLSTSSINIIMGFSSTITSFSNNLLMNYPLNLSGIQKVSLYSNFLTTKNICNYGGLIFSIPINSVSIISYENKTGHSNILSNTYINQLDFQVRDENGLLLDFANQNWSITLRFILHKILNTNKTLEEHLSEN